MKNFIKSILFIIIGVMILSYFNNLYINTNYYKSLDYTERFNHVPNNIEVANVGSSHGMYGFDYTDFDVVGFNFGLYAQGFYYDYRMLKQYSPKIKEGATIIIPISYFSLYQSYEDEKFEEFNKSYYRFLNPRYIKNIKLKKYVTDSLFPLLSEGGNIKKVFKDIEHKPKEWEIITWNKFAPNEGIREEGHKRSMHHQKDIINPGKVNKPETKRELKNIINYCIENNYKPVLVTLPYLKYYNDFFPDAFYSEFYGEIEDIRKQYEGLEYMDYSHDKRFTSDIDLFVDSDHMNVNGRKKMTQIILKDLGIIK
ncbi:SGNH/GDSL hydrolase family protein [Lutibacter sp. B2]|nr:SGNH/GDSL hydrolase family protein [Lutibacter sp. B2]